MSRRFVSPRLLATLVLSSTVLACADTGGNGDVQEPETTGGGDTTTAPGQPSASNSNGTSSGETAPSSPNVNPIGEPSSSPDTTDETSMASTSTTTDATSSGEEVTTSAGEETAEETADETDSESGSGTGSDSGSETEDGETSVSADDNDGGPVDTTSDAGTNGNSSDVTSDTGSTVEVPVCPSEPALTGGQRYCSNQRGNAGNGYGYELWAEGGGSGCMTVFGSGAAFSASWSDVEDFLARVGLDFDETRTHQQIGNIWAEFAETQTGSEDGLTYIGIYGWTVDPLREFYILDDWGVAKPGGLASDGSPRDEVGVLEIDGETYDVWKKARIDKPSIKGTTTFDQYFSIRRTRRSCGRISVSEHFAGFERLGLPFGKLYEVKLLVESQFNTGSVEFTSAEVRVD